MSVSTAQSVMKYPEAFINSLMMRDETSTCKLIAAGDNKIWHVNTRSGKQYIFRHVLTDNLQCFSRELCIATFAASIEVAPLVVKSDQERCQMLMQYVVTEEWPSFSVNPKPYYETMHRIREFHNRASTEFSAEKKPVFAPFPFILETGSKFISDNSSLPSHFIHALDRIRKIFDHVKPWIEQNAKLCHGDFHMGNVLFTKERVYLIDWEDCVWGDPIFDVVKFSIRFAHEERLLLFKEYLGQQPTESEQAHFELIDLALLMVVSINRMRLAYEDTASEKMTKQTMEELLDSASLPSFLEVPFHGNAAVRQKASIYALSEFLKRSDETPLTNLLCKRL